MTMKIVITGGHHSSALPVIKELQLKDPTVSLHWFGHKHTLLGDKNTSLEYRELTQLGIKFYDLKAGKVYRTFNLVRLLKVPYGFIQALMLLLKIRPNVVLSFGGYLAVPTVVAAWLLGIPCVTHEQTSVAGYANKFIAPFVKTIMVSFEESKTNFKHKNVVYTGLPLRSEIFEVSSNNLIINNDLPTIYITAGKTGSHILNLGVTRILEQLLSKANVIHQCGDYSVVNDYEMLRDTYTRIKGNVRGKYFLRKFVLGDEIGEVFSKSSMFVSRGGAHTVNEIITFGMKALIIPIPWVSHNEQYLNALSIERAGLGEIYPEKDLGDYKKFLENIYKVLESAVTKKVIEYDNLPAERIVHETLKVAKVL